MVAEVEGVVVIVANEDAVGEQVDVDEDVADDDEEGIYKGE